MPKKKTSAAKAASDAARALGRSSWSKAGRARAERLTPEQRSAIARAASRKRWGTKLAGADLHTEEPPLAAHAINTELARVLAIMAFQDIHQIEQMSEGERARRKEMRRMLLSGENPLPGAGLTDLARWEQEGS